MGGGTRGPRFQITKKPTYVLMLDNMRGQSSRQEVSIVVEAASGFLEYEEQKMKVVGRVAPTTNTQQAKLYR